MILGVSLLYVEWRFVSIIFGGEDNAESGREVRTKE
jgi:hypothetical protein